MNITAIKTHKITVNENLNQILDVYLPRLEEKSVVIITSKIISICQGNVIKNDGTIDKKELIKKEAEYYFEDPNLDRFGVVIPTIKKSILIANSGIDESNADGNFILWPKELDQTTNEIWKYLTNKHQLKSLGIIVTDSRLTPLRWGIQGIGISWCGFKALLDHRGQPDIFGRTIKMEQQSILDGLANSATIVMGEAAEQTPLAIITNVPFVTFQNRPPTKAERELMLIEKDDDIYGKLLTSVEWKKGTGKI